MNFLLILIALLISGIAVLAVVSLGGERAVPRRRVLQRRGP